MINIEKIQKAIEQINLCQAANGDCLELINAVKNLEQFLVSNQTRVKRGKVNIFDYTDPKAVNTIFRGVFYDAENKYAVATNGGCIYASKNLFNEEFAGRIINKKGEEVLGRFPRYMCVLNQFNGDGMNEIGIPESFTADYLYNCIKECAALKKMNKTIHPMIKVTNNFYLDIKRAKLVKDLDFSTLVIKQSKGDSTYQAIISMTSSECAIIMGVNLLTDESNLVKHDLVYTYP